MRSKKVLRFSLARKGYDIGEVEDYIAAEKQRTDEVQLAQRERITELNAQIAKLESERDALKGREEQIKSALIAATDNANRLNADIKEKYTRELNRLKLFRAKWNGAYEQLKERYHFDKDALNMESVAVSAELELQKCLAQDFSLSKGDDENEMEEYFKSEVERLTTRQNAPSNAPSQPATPAVKELKEKIKRKNGAAAFSLEEALNPTEPLPDILNALLSEK